MRPHRRQPTRLLHPWDSPGKGTGVGCHCLLQCMKVKVKVKSCPTLCDPINRSLPGSSIHGIFQGRVLEWGAIAFSELLTYKSIYELKQHNLNRTIIWGWLEIWTLTNHMYEHTVMWRSHRYTLQKSGKIYWEKSTKRELRVHICSHYLFTLILS